MGQAIYQEVLRQVGQRIRALRTAASLSQEELAFEAGIDRTFVSQIERGVCNPSLVTLLKVCTALQQPIHALFSDVRTRKRRDIRRQK